MAPKGKQGTKGQKQIATENKSTVRFYMCIISTVSVAYFGIQYSLFWESFTKFTMFLGLLATSVNLGALKFMSYMGRATYGSSGAVVDGGIDLNMESGVSEHAKDLIILTSTVQGFSLLSTYAWILWLVAPARASYVIWVNFLGPWFFQPGEEVSEKKTKKMERRMRRQ